MNRVSGWVRRAVGIVSLTLLLAAGAGGCSVDSARYQSQIFPCDVASADSGACGDGWGCYAAAQPLGAPAFCAPACDPMQPPPAGAVCTQGSVLHRCSPAAAGPCAPGTSCIRTNLLEDAGVCMPLAACAHNADCRDPIRSECFSSEVGAIYTRRPDLAEDALFCIQSGCLERQEACAEGTTCLPVELGRGLPDVCTPNCDARGRCPPSFVCSSRLVPSSTNPFCIPGLLGFRCTNDLECLLGSCRDIDGERLCTSGCNTSADCSPYDNANFLFPAVFSCVGGQCLSPFSFLLAFCKIGHADADCGSGIDCRAIFPNLPAGLGLCVEPCTAGAQCPMRGGFPQSCADLPGGLGCIIGVFGVSCSASSECIANLTCAQASTSSSGRICTAPCTTNDDCTGDREIGSQSYCIGAVLPGQPNVCAPKLDPGRPCELPIQCKSGVCNCPLGSCTPGTCG